MKLLELITEDHKHDYGCVMLYFDFPEMKEIQNIINSDDIYEDETDDSFGLETEPHVTLLFGLHDGVSTENVKKSLRFIEFGTCIASNLSIFENDEYDVLKYDVSGEGLIEANNQLKKYPYTSDFPEYHPHMTIAYLKPATGKKYTKQLKNSSFKLTPKHGVYSKSDGSKEKFNIIVKK